MGTLDRPFGSWSDFDSLLRPGFAQTLMTAVSLGKVRVIVVQYRRENQVGQTAFLVSASSGVQILGALETVPTSQAVRRLRAGQGSDDLATKSVAVVGAGAVGSHVVDLLLRRGVGKVTVVDGESLRPGNAVRHLLARSEYELSDKATALRDHTSGYGFVPESAVTAERKRLLTISDAEELLRSHDLVVDATASGQASTLLADAASDSPAHLVIVALQRDGGIIRVDSFPGEGHADPLPENISGSVLLTEAGCIDPVSPVTPDAVVEAAVWAVRVAIDRLLGEGRFGPTVIVVNKEQPHPLYDRLGVIV